MVIKTSRSKEHSQCNVDGLMAFELMKRNSSYPMALMCKHFANNNSLPEFPHVSAHKLLTSWKPPGGRVLLVVYVHLCKDSGKALALEHPKKA
ncbi:hypothetical protein WN944_001803 [Citrus x changshan-huyou]|uniref:Uncharacterized protein n=1 Tax=Citrus x changshan-huyou TaxID=2935761 RepID=A0AAP0MFC4_9ROSI